MQKSLKLISLAVIAALVLTALPLASFAQTDDAAEPVTLSSLSDASVERTNALGILSDSDILLPSADKTTRAEFVNWVVKMLGMADSSADSVYSDVPDDYWAADSINTACGLKLISKADNFNPDSAISLAEAQKILVCAIGYEPAAQQNGGWPAGYVSVASRLGISKGISQSDAEGISRFDAVKMLDNMLDVKVMKTNYNGVYEQSDETVLSEYLDVDVVSAAIKEVLKKDGQIRAVTDGKEKLYNIADSVNIALIVEDDAELYVREVNGRDTVLYIDYNGTVSVVYDYISEVNESADGERYTTSQIKKIYLQNADKEYKTDSSAVVTLNDASAATVPVILSGTFAKIVMRSDKVYKIEAYSLYEGGIVYLSSPDRIKYVCGDVNDNVMDKIDEVDDLQLYIDGVPHTNMYDLKSDMVFDYYISPDEEKLIIVASSRTFNKKLDGSGTNTLVLDGVEYSISPEYGLYVYSNTRSRYQKNASFDTYLGKTIKAFVDDNMYVRYIKISDDAENADSFYGVIMATATGGSALNTDGGKIKVFKITGGQGEKEYEVDAKRMKNSPIKMDYIRAYAGNTEGKSFLKLTTNKENKIVKAEPIDLWGSVKKFTGKIDKTSDYWLDNLYMRTATMFAVFNDHGEFKVKILDWDDDMRDTRFESEVTVISDYDPMYNPKPSFVMFGTGSESHRSAGAQSGFVQSITYLADDMVRVKLYNKYGAKTYNIKKSYFDTLGIKENMLIEWYYSIFTEDEIRIHSKRDTSGSTDTWPVDNATYSSGATSGFYKADSILYRDGKVVQFMVNGEPTDLLPVNTYYVVYELVHTKDGYTLVDNKKINPLGYINSNDNVWFEMYSWGPAPRSVATVIYEKTSITGN